MPTALRTSCARPSDGAHAWRAAALVCALVALPASLPAQIILSESAKYPPLRVASDTRKIGMSLGAMPWAGDFAVVAPGLCYSNSGVLRSAGNCFQMQGQTAMRLSLDTGQFGQLTNRAGCFATTGATLWISFLMRVQERAADAGYAGLALCNRAAQTFFIGLPPQRSNICVRTDLTGGGRIGRTLVDTKPTLLILVRLDYQVEGVHVAWTTNPKFGEWDLLPTPGELLFTNSCFDRVELLCGPGTVAQFDEIRLGTAYADAAPLAVAEEQAAPRTDLPASGLPASVFDSILVAKGDRGEGTAFFARQDGKVYLFSNIHVLMGNRGVKFLDQHGTQYKPVALEGASDRDLVRISVVNPPTTALPIAVPRVSETPIAVCGNAGGEEVMRPVKGVIVGIGPTKVEVDAGFVRGHSGSPIVTPEGAAVGIATYMTRTNPDWTNTNTPFTVTRRFGYRLDNVKTWIPISPKWFVKESEAVRRRDELLMDVAEMLSLWAISPYWFEMPLDTNLPPALVDWVEKHNAEVVKNKERFRTGSTSASRAAQLSRDMQTALKAEVVQLKAELPKAFSAPGLQWHLPFFKETWDDCAMQQQALLRAIDFVQSVHTGYEPVHIR